MLPAGRSASAAATAGSLGASAGQHRRDRRRGGGVGRSPAGEPGGTADATGGGELGLERAARPNANDSADHGGRVLAGGLGVERDLPRASSAASHSAAASRWADRRRARRGRGHARRRTPRRAGARRSGRSRPAPGALRRAGRRAAGHPPRRRTPATAAGRAALVAPGDDHRPLGLRQEGDERACALGRARPVPGRPRQPRPPARPPAAAGLGRRQRRVEHERLAQREVQVHGAGPPSVAVHTARQASARIHRSRSGVAAWRADVEEPLGVVAVELELVDRLAGADLAQLRRPVGGEDDQRDPRLVRLDRPPAGSARPPSRSCTSPPPGGPWPCPAPRAKKPATRSSTCDQHGRRPSRTSERTSGVEREPGDVQAPATPQRTSSSTKARSRRYVSAVSVKMSCRMAETVVLLHGFAGTRHAWDLVADRLDPERYRPLALDLRGHGAARDARPITFAACVGRRRSRSAPERVRARAATRSAAGSRCTSRWRTPQRVSRLVLVASTAGIEDAAPRAERRAADERSPPRPSRARSRRSPTAGASCRCSPAPPRPRRPSGAPTCCATTRSPSRPRCAGIGAGVMEPLWDRLGELDGCR